MKTHENIRILLSGSRELENEKKSFLVFADQRIVGGRQMGTPFLQNGDFEINESFEGITAHVEDLHVWEVKSQVGNSGVFNTREEALVKATSERWDVVIERRRITVFLKVVSDKEAAEAAATASAFFSEDADCSVNQRQVLLQFANFDKGEFNFR